MKTIATKHSARAECICKRRTSDPIGSHAEIKPIDGKPPEKPGNIWKEMPKYPPVEGDARGFHVRMNRPMRAMSRFRPSLARRVASRSQGAERPAQPTTQADPTRTSLYGKYQQREERPATDSVWRLIQFVGPDKRRRTHRLGKARYRNGRSKRSGGGGTSCGGSRQGPRHGRGDGPLVVRSVMRPVGQAGGGPAGQPTEGPLIIALSRCRGVRRLPETLALTWAIWTEKARYSTI